MDNLSLKVSPVKEVLGDYHHPLHEAAMDVACRLQTGEVFPCACVGPRYGEPYCLCVMNQKGLSLSEERYAAEKETEARLASIDWSSVLKGKRQP